MRFWPLLFALGASAALAAKPAVVVSGPPALTRLVSKELSKKYAPKPGSLSPMPTAKEVREATGPHGAIAAVLCSSAGAFITLQVLNGADGTPLDTITLKGTLKKLPKTLPKPQLAALFFAVGSGKAPGKEAPPPPAVTETPREEPKVAPKKEEPVKEVAKTEAPAPKKPAKAEEPPPTVVSRPAEPTPPASNQPAVRLSVGFGGFNRSFGWSGNPSPSLATATWPFSGNIAVEAAWYPGAHFTSSFLANLGLYTSGDFGIGIVSRVGLEESRFAHSSSRLRFGGLVRLPIGTAFTLHAHLGYARQTFTTSTNAINDGSARPNIPDLLFNGFRGGLGLRVRMFGTVELDAQGGFMTVANKGELASDRYFPAATAFAVDAGGGLSVEVAPSLRLRAGAEWNRYFITLNPAEDSTFFARSAADQYITATASIQWVM
ncbi:MAG: hypothetical protein ACOZQL_03285 [Myxococcota bacterium]